MTASIRSRVAVSELVGLVVEPRCRAAAPARRIGSCSFVSARSSSTAGDQQVGHRRGRSRSPARRPIGILARAHRPAGAPAPGSCSAAPSACRLDSRWLPAVARQRARRMRDLAASGAVGLGIAGDQILDPPLQAARAAARRGPRRPAASAAARPSPGRSDARRRRRRRPRTDGGLRRTRSASARRRRASPDPRPAIRPAPPGSSPARGWR